MYQQIIIVGNVGGDPEMRYTQSGTPVTSFSVAVNKRWTGQGGQRQEKVTWFRVSAWRQLAELASQYLAKGRQVMVVGEVEEPNVWTDQSGNNRASLEITAREIRFLGGRDDTAGAETQTAPAQSATPAVANVGPVSDEDIPF